MTGRLVRGGLSGKARWGRGGATPQNIILIILAILAWAEQAAALEVGNAEIRRRMEEMKAQAEGLREQAKDTGRRVEELMAQRTQGEARQTALRQQSRDKADERERAGREAARIEEKCAAAQKEADDLIRRLYEEYELTRSEAETQLANLQTAARAGSSCCLTWELRRLRLRKTVRSWPLSR